MNRELSIEELCKKLKPIFGKKIDAIYMKYALASSREEREEVEHFINALYKKNLGELLDSKVLLEPPKQEVIDGDYALGDVSYSGKKLFPFTLREQDWPRHVCISGMSGSGKTTLAFHILENFISKNKPFLVFDWKKSFRPLLKASSDIMCFTIGNEQVTNLFKMNINQPPKGVDSREWINVLCDLLTESFSASYGVHKVLLETLDESFKEWGIYDGSENYPTWEHIKFNLEQKLDKAKGRESGWLESALRIASVMTFGNFGKVCTYKGEDSLNMEDLLDKKVIFELNSLSTVEKKFFCEFILTYIYKMKKFNQKSFESKFDSAILVDEAHNIFLKDSPMFTKESVTDMIYREMREYGTSLICLDQHISKLSDTIKGNSACHIAFQQQLPQDIMDVSALMQLRDQRKYFSMLPVGSAIVKLSERYAFPFLIEVANSVLRENFVTDADVISRTKNLMLGIGVEKGVDEEFSKALVSPPSISVLSEFNQKVVPAHPPRDSKVIPAHQSIDNKAVNEKQKETLDKIVEEKPVEIKVEVPKLEPIEVEVKPIEKIEVLTSKQKILYEFICKETFDGKNLDELENLLEEYKEDGGYVSEDIRKAINNYLTQKLKKNSGIVTSEKGQTNGNIYKDESLDEYCLGDGQKKFVAFLQSNQNQDYGTVDIYKSLGLSSRKGNQIKKELLEKNLIKIEEQKNEKGWKKIIKLV